MASNNSFLDVLGTIDGKVQRMSTEVKTIPYQLWKLLQGLCLE